MTKKHIRNQMIHSRRMYPLDQKRHDDEIIARTLLSLDLIQRSASICTYISMHDEVDTKTFILKLLKQNKHAIIVPKVKGNILEFYRIYDLNHLKQSKFGVLEPDVNCQSVPVEYADVYIAAGLAFAPDGYRIGYGKGYMDWTFSKTDVPRVAIGYDFQVLESVPHEAYDKKVDILVTPTRIINCTKRIKL